MNPIFELAPGVPVHDIDQELPGNIDHLFVEYDDDDDDDDDDDSNYSYHSINDDQGATIPDNLDDNSNDAAYDDNLDDNSNDEVDNLNEVPVVDTDGATFVDNYNEAADKNEVTDNENDENEDINCSNGDDDIADNGNNI